METLFQKLAEKADSDRLAAEHEWASIVGKVAAGTATEKEVVSALKSSGRPLADLKVAVKKQRRIAELQDVVAQYAAANEALSQATAAETAFNLERQAEFSRNRDEGIRVRSAALDARANFNAIAVAQHELDGLVGTRDESLEDAA